ncbi:MAG: hypothetical protein ACOCZ5_00335 [bacterium]
MAQFNENILIGAPNPIDFKYLSPRMVGGIQQPYSGSTEVLDKIPTTQRHVGLTVLIDDGSGSKEYWFRDDINTLIEKGGDGSGDGTITGATNIGFFSGTSSIQEIRLAPSSGFDPVSGVRDDYDGSYYSVFNNYYRDIDGYIRVGLSPLAEAVFGEPTPLRGYVKTETPVKSWIWNDDPDPLESGWELIDGDVELLVGEFVDIALYHENVDGPYQVDVWVDQSYTVGDRSLTISGVDGDLTSGTPIVQGAPVYAQTSDDGTELELRTIRSITPDSLTITYDSTFINISSTNSKVITGATNGLNVPTTGNINIVELGGDLTDDVIIDGGEKYSLTIYELETLRLGATNGLLESGSNNPFEYGGDYFGDPINTYSPNSIPDLKTVTGYTQTSGFVKNVCNLSVSAYQVLPNDFYIGAEGGAAITLPNSPTNGMVVVVADNCGNAAEDNEIQVNAGGGSQFFGGSSFSLISTPYGSYTYIYNCGMNKWGVLAFNPAAV